jgi:hypothetical protein
MLVGVDLDFGGEEEGDEAEEEAGGADARHL